MGINQSWRQTQDVDAHFTIDHDQFYQDGALPYYAEMLKRRCLYVLNYSPTRRTKGEPYPDGNKFDRHDELRFSRRPFQKRHRGHHTPAPPLEQDGGIVLKVGPEAGGSVCYLALQMVAAMPFERIFFVGLDMTDKKFEGAYGYPNKPQHNKPQEPVHSGAFSSSSKHDKLWGYVPQDVRDKVRVIAPSTTRLFQIIPWPWETNH